MAAAANSPTGVGNTDPNDTSEPSPWTQTLFFEPSYGSSVTFENQSYDIAFGDGYYNVLSKSENSLKTNFKDNRGIIVDILENENINAITYITIKKGKIRGNHYHKKTYQWNYVISGKMKLITKHLIIF